MDGEIESLAVTLCLYVGLPALVLFVGWLVGHLSETRHERSLARREEMLNDVETSDMRSPPGFSGAEGPCMLVSGEAVVASDAFKTWVFGLKNIVGGESKTFTRLFDRARREWVFFVICARAEEIKRSQSVFSIFNLSIVARSSLTACCLSKIVALMPFSVVACEF